MKILSTLCFLLFVQNVFCQTKVNNDKIGTVKELKIYGDNPKITIGKIIINQTLQTKLYLIKIEQKRDSSNFWNTSIYLGNKDRLPLFGANLSFKFSSPVDSAGYAGALIQYGLEYNFKDKLNYYYKSSEIIRQYDNPLVIVFFFKSAEKINVTISGVDGILPTD